MPRIRNGIKKGMIIIEVEYGAVLHKFELQQQSVAFIP
jgi:hypothetical protein